MKSLDKEHQKETLDQKRYRQALQARDNRVTNLGPQSGTGGGVGSQFF